MERDGWSLTGADRRRRHCCYRREEIHELQLGQRQLKRLYHEWKYQRLDERVRSLEIEQHRIADVNFNLSRQIATLDKLHTSMLELLENVEDVQNKVDKSVPEIRHEISKLEFTSGQLTSKQRAISEEVRNTARSLQALVNTVTTQHTDQQTTMTSINALHVKTDRLQNLLDVLQRRTQNFHKTVVANRKLDAKDEKSFFQVENGQVSRYPCTSPLPYPSYAPGGCSFIAQYDIS